MLGLPWLVLAGLYAKLIGGVGLGVVVGRLGQPDWATRLGRWLYWVGIPIGCVAFFRQAQLTGGAAWLAPIAAWGAIGLGALLATLWLRHRGERSAATRGSFWLATMFGNTGYLGFPVGLSLAGEAHFGWILFYDLVGTTLGAYGLGAAVAARLGGQATDWRGSVRAALVNPTLWGAIAGLATKPIALPLWGEQALKTAGWTVVGLSLALIGMRLSRLRLGRSLPLALAALVIKMLIVPLILGTVLVHLGWSGPPLLAVTLQAAMPPAFATLAIAEAYDLDRDLAVTVVALGSIVLLFTLPLWLIWFGHVA